MASNAVVHHMDYDAAARQDISGGPYEILTDASDDGWCAVLCQRPEMVRHVANGFSECSDCCEWRRTVEEHLKEINILSARTGRDSNSN